MVKNYSKKTQNLNAKELRKIDGGDSIIVGDLVPIPLDDYPPHKRPVLIVDFPFWIRRP